MSEFEERGVFGRGVFSEEGIESVRAIVYGEACHSAGPRGHGVVNPRNLVLNRAARLAASLAPGAMERRLRNPVFFVGSGRSGTNLLAGLLSSHADVAVYPYEANDLWHPGAYPWETSARATAPIWKDPYAFTAATLARRTAADDRRLRAVLGAYEALTRGACVVNKSVMITFMIPHVLSVFPDARFIHLLRDGRAVAVSYARHTRRRIDRAPASYREWELDLPLDRLTFEFARHWKEHVAEIEARKAELDSSSRLFEVRYEELVAEPKETLERLAGFLDVDPAGFDRRRWPTIDDRNYKFREATDEPTLARLSALMEPELSHKGYGRLATAEPA